MRDEFVKFIHFPIYSRASGSAGRRLPDMRQQDETRSGMAGDMPALRRGDPVDFSAPLRVLRESHRLSGLPAARCPAAVFCHEPKRGQIQRDDAGMARPV